MRLVCTLKCRAVNLSEAELHSWSLLKARLQAEWKNPTMQKSRKVQNVSEKVKEQILENNLCAQKDLSESVPCYIGH